MARPRATIRGRMPPPARGKPYYDADRGRMRIVPKGGGRAVDYVGPRTGFNAGKALRRAGVQTRTLADKAADATAGRVERVGGAILSEAKPAGFGQFLIAAAATLLGLIVLDLILSARGAGGVERGLGLVARGIERFVSPADTLVPATAAAATPPKTTKPGGGGGGGRFVPTSAEGRAFPVPGGSFVNDWGATRSGGRMHKGIDIFAALGTPAAAVAGGEVIWIGESGLGGNHVWIRTELGDFYYAHLDRIDVRKGQHVVGGERIGTVGNTGNAAGGPPHLHFGWAPAGFSGDGSWRNPYSLLRELDAEPRPRKEP